MENYCIACGMPLEQEEYIGGKTEEGLVCIHCANEDGGVKTGKEIFEGGVEFFTGAVPGMEREMAEKITRKNMNSLPYWQGKNEECLKGEEATDEEFQEAMDKLEN